MKILYISTSFPKPNDSSTIYTDLAEELTTQGHEVTVVVTEEKRKSSNTQMNTERNMSVLRVLTGNLYDVNLIEKGITILLMQYQLKSAIKKHLKNQDFDMVLFESPPVTTASVVAWAMKYFNCPSYLMLKDIFPQNAIDIGIMKKSNPVYLYFKSKEKKLYDTASIIGTMSKANQEYVIKHYPNLDPEKVKLFPNTKKISKTSIERDNRFRLRHGIPISAALAVYGGNMGKPQGLDFLCDILNSNKNVGNIFFLLVGRGTEKAKIAKFIKDNAISNALILDSLHRDEYEEMLNEADIGMVFLDKRFTIPNFPSRVLSYFEKSIPVLAAIDRNTDFGDMIQASKSGYYAIAGELNDFNNKLMKLVGDSDKRLEMGRSGYNYLLENYDVEYSVKLIEEHVASIGKNSGVRQNV